jgi:hypothetical protein
LRSAPQSTESHPPRSQGYSLLPFWENIRITNALLLQDSLVG